MRCTTADDWVVQGYGGRTSSRALQTRNFIPITYVFDLKRKTLSMEGNRWPIRVIHDNPLEIAVVSGQVSSFSIREHEFTLTAVLGQEVEMSFGFCVRERRS